MQTPEALNAAFASGNPHDVVVAALRFAAARTVLDVGCGGGRLVGRLIREGFDATGVDPAPLAVETARRTVPAAGFAEAGAEALPFEAGRFDAVVFMNSLHHVPAERMADALAEARRVVRQEAAILIVEPLAEGSYFEAMRPVEDETAIRQAAGAAIADAVRAGRLRLRGNVVFEETIRFADVDAFLARLVAVDPARAVLAERRRDEVERRFRECSQPDAAGRRLQQPLRIYWLAPAQD
ncbi:class I SAM-dependent methyltransferase [Jiella sonneratiae]|uniref:Class I SAM-dependent methyltransferase n=1 Tax=Jiella sonneratiae TaxID=2816856 RepID=A0ABS3J6M8_9HYPH|nr:class I SAM-dependent methyltransferase [Jiella sonneratiae]MBO0904628.1 class I SAM-dependent methyltransferase [Jiella sonneratiae]